MFYLRHNYWNNGIANDSDIIEETKRELIPAKLKMYLVIKCTNVTSIIVFALLIQFYFDCVMGIKE